MSNLMKRLAGRLTPKGRDALIAGGKTAEHIKVQMSSGLYESLVNEGFLKTTPTQEEASAYANGRALAREIRIKLAMK